MKILKSNGISAFGGLNFVIEELDNREIGKILNEVLPKLGALPDVYDFVIKLEPSLRGVFRDYATMLGQMYNGGGTPYNIQFIGTAKIKN